MSAFNDLNGVPTSANPFTLTKVLRDEWKFDGFVVSDYDDFEANRALWSITDLDSKGERVKTIPTPICFSDFSKIILKQARVSSFPSLSPSCVS